MKICNNCGHAISDEDRFCGNCGKPTNKSSNLFRHPLLEKERAQRSGLIFTDSSKLAQTLNVSRSIILSSLDNYIKTVAPYISYKLFDIANVSDNITSKYYVSSFSQGKSTKGWRNYHQLLFKDKYFSFHNELEYLFIIGGDDVIPVPYMRNCMPNKYGELVPTDILYGYKINTFSANEEDINTIIRSKLAYYVGRLPLSTDATFDQLQNYLGRAANYMEKGIPVQIAYAQADPHWKRVSMEVLSDLDQQQLLPDIQAPSSLLYKKVFLSPYVTCDTIDKAFNPYSNLYYFNMHGSGKPNAPQFFGESMEDKSLYAGIDPQTIGCAKYDNIVVTEACYGGKHIGLATNMSMLLSSISNTTMLYLGSSVVAYGIIDNTFKNKSDICSADIMAKEFIYSLMEGYSAGESVFKARRRLFNSQKGGDTISNLLTIFEFSLYGDPALKALFPNQRKVTTIYQDDTSDRLTNDTLQYEEVYNENPTSILTMVRNKVDSSLQSLNDDIQKKLKEYGIETRQLASITKVRYGTMSQHVFTYKAYNGVEPVVIVDDYDHSKTLLMPKGIIEQNFNDARRLSIDYSSIFQSYCRRFGLISIEDNEQPVLEGGGASIKTVYIDKRIEPKSKRQIKTFNAVLDQVYRPNMRNSNIASLSTKDCDYDFSLLINPLAILLETELRLGLKALIKKEGSGWPSDPTLGSLVHSLMDNRHLLSRRGINGGFLSWIGNVPEYRNPASHSGGITEEKFLNFYDLFIKIVSSPDFSKVLELKQNYK